MNGSYSFAAESSSHFDQLHHQIRQKFHAFAAGVRAAEKAGITGVSEECRRIETEIHALYTKMDEEVARLKVEGGIPDSFVDLLDELIEAEGADLDGDDRYWRHEVQEVPTTVQLEAVVGSGLDNLLQIVDPEWLNEQRQYSYRQTYRNDGQPARLHLVGRDRLLPETGPKRPHRFAEMLLIAQDLLDNRNDLDFFSGSVLVSEVAVLGAALDLISELGSEAETKLYGLHRMPTGDVAAAVYELLVGTSCIQCGRKMRMLPASGAGKSPDFRAEDQVVPTVVECKRRDGLGKYFTQEAREVERLFDSVAQQLERYHLSVEVLFEKEVRTVESGDFVAKIEALLATWNDPAEIQTDWGKIAIRRLPITCDIAATRVFSPNFLREVFAWDHLGNDWDGILCEIDSPGAPATNRVECPRCLKWKCVDPASVLKKSRGLTSLWVSAVEQVPTGEMGCVYIAYSENMRPEIADARTQHLMDACKSWYIKRYAPIPLTIIGRLYSQSLGNGGLDFIESTMPLVGHDANHMLADFPTRIFTLPG